MIDPPFSSDKVQVVMCPCAARVLLDHLHLTILHSTHDRHVPVAVPFPPVQYDKVAALGWGCTPIGELQEPSVTVHGAIRNGPVEEVTRMSVTVRHPMPEALQIVPLHEFDTLVAKAHIVSVHHIATMHLAEAIVVSYDHAIKTVQWSAGLRW